MFTVVLCIFVVVKMFALHFSCYLFLFYYSILFLFYLCCMYLCYIYVIYIMLYLCYILFMHPTDAAGSSSTGSSSSAARCRFRHLRVRINSIRSVRCTVMCIMTFIFTTQFLYTVRSSSSQKCRGPVEIFFLKCTL